MRVGKQSAPRCQSINIRSSGLRMPTKAPDPVIQVINRDEQHIRPRFRRACFNTNQDSEDKDDQSAFQGNSIAFVKMTSAHETRPAAKHGATVF